MLNESFWRGRRVFVTGHTGFKGAWLSIWLHRLGATLAGYALAPPTHPNLFDLARVGELVETTIADVRDLDRLTACLHAFKPDVVLHMAAQSVVLTCYADPVEAYSTNVMGTVNLLEAVRRAGLRAAVVNVTTDKIYLNQGWVWSYRENDPLGGRDPYSNSKACSELVTQAYRHSYFPATRRAEHGVTVATARAGNVIGGGDWTAHQLIPMAIDAFSRGEPVELRHPDAIRPWQHVLDCLRGYLMLAQALTNTALDFDSDWNFGPSPDESITVAEVAETLARHWRVAAAWCQSPGVHPHEERELRLDSSKAARSLGWRCRLTTASALEWVADWYLQTAAGRAARRVCEEQIDAYQALSTTGPVRSTT